MVHKRNINGVLNHAKEKSKKTSESVEQALKTAIREKLKINFNSIASLANVSKSYLYNNKEFRLRIETLREQQMGIRSPNFVRHKTSDDSKDTIIEALTHKMRALESENSKLIKENKQLLSQLYEEL
ncbi:DUF6262 family protein [Staphylococcus equorum]|uniref:DUF6262 family protein n=1 Tax=Staphylococcus equorum TaxID=246432 RepID=UPI003EB8C091